MNTNPFYYYRIVVVDEDGTAFNDDVDFVWAFDDLSDFFGLAYFQRISI